MLHTVHARDPHRDALILGEWYCVLKQAVWLHTSTKCRGGQIRAVAYMYTHMADTEGIERTGLWDMGTYTALHWDADVWLYKILCKAPCPP